jgi:catechol 2,3-dioxygenase-like lactoylglutathione lyase family enzyme
MADILDVHHEAAIARHPQRNVDVYAGVLGLRLVKITVNLSEAGRPFAEGVFDVEDLKFWTEELAYFIVTATISARRSGSQSGIPTERTAPLLRFSSIRIASRLPRFFARWHRLPPTSFGTSVIFPFSSAGVTEI